MANPADGPDVYKPTTKNTGRQNSVAQNVTTNKRNDTVHGEKVDYIQVNA